LSRYADANAIADPTTMEPKRIRNAEPACRKPSLSQLFPYVCPEPVLVK
jgi:hypothetical protein